MSARLVPFALIVLAYAVIFALRAAGKVARASPEQRRRAGFPLYGGMVLYVAAALLARRDAPDLGALFPQYLGAVLIIAGLCLSLRWGSEAR